MSACIHGREVELQFSSKNTGHRWTATVVCPAEWTEERLLNYCSSEHPNEEVSIKDWRDNWVRTLWIVDVNGGADD